MHYHRGSALYMAGRALKGRFNLQFIVLTTVILFWVVLVLILYMLLTRLYYHFKRRRMDARRKLYDPAVELVLTEAPLPEIIAALRPKEAGDEEVVEEVILDAMQPLTGGPFEALQAAAVELGFVERNLRALKARSRFRRSQAMETLGIMRVKPAIAAIGALLPAEALGMKLVALRALALIGDPQALPLLERTADSLPPAMLPRLASLMLEFGEPAKPFIEGLIRNHASSFTPRIMKILLKETAATEGLE
ncbi:MAG: hypothetical protein HY077_11825 [Elusimicrobia bacterium]|nr:hypothetical protein [Elusimicrobiota bacterium]